MNIEYRILNEKHSPGELPAKATEVSGLVGVW